MPSALRAPPPLLDREQREQASEHELHHVHPGRGLAALAGVASAGREQDDRADDGEADDPSRDERGSVGAGARRAEHQHDGDDGHGAERDAHAERQDLSDRLAHPGHGRRAVG
jgi:hypothetical protein